jgi:hypothetical protein
MKHTEHLTEEAMQLYRERAASTAERLAVQTHVAHCTECRARLEQVVDANAAFLSLQQQLTSTRFSLDDEPNHLAYEQLVQYLDNGLDEIELEIADSHLAICEDCAGDLADLRRYQTLAIRETSAQSEQPATMDAETSAPGVWPERTRLASQNTRSAWRRFFAFDFFPTGGAFVPAGVAVAVLAILLLGIWFASRSRMGSREEIVKVEPVNQNVAQPSPATVSPTPVVQNSPQNFSSPAPQPTQSLPKALPDNSQRPAANEAPALALNDGGDEVRLDADGNFIGLESQPASVREAVRRSLQARRAQTPRAIEAIAEGRTGVLMSGSPEATNNGVPFALVAPVGKVVRESQPTLRWQSLAGAKSYQVAVVDSKFRVVAQSPVLTDTQWTLTQALPRGANYSWQITATQEDGAKVNSPVAPAPQAKFRVMEQSAFDEVARMENSGVRSHLLRGVVYAGAGLLDEARAEFTALVKDNPRSQLARSLLKSVNK